MAEVVGVNLDSSKLSPYVGSDVGVFFGIKHSKEPIVGTCDATNKAFVLPADKVPYMDIDNSGVVDKDDIVVYDDGVAVEVSSFDPKTRTATLEAAPAADSVMTADFTELGEFIIATDFDLKNKQKSTTWTRCRSRTETTIYTNQNVTLDVSMDINGKDTYKLGFDDTSKVMYSSPLEVAIAIVFFQRNSTEVDWGFYIEKGDVVFDDLAKVKSDGIGTCSANIAVDGDVKLLSMAAYPLDAGVATS